ncbi:MAG: MFS transporter, partial [Anaerolineae bacterium]|nr:MFS transporter [Anaerolineae bacterium]
MMKTALRRRLTHFVLILLAIELLDELVYGAGEAAWPLIRDDLLLNYVQIGLLQTLPRIIGTLLDPFIGILGDTNKRRL